MNEDIKALAKVVRSALRSVLGSTHFCNLNVEVRGKVIDLKIEHQDKDKREVSLRRRA